MPHYLRSFVIRKLTCRRGWTIGTADDWEKWTTKRNDDSAEAKQREDRRSREAPATAVVFVGARRGSRASLRPSPEATGIGRRRRSTLRSPSRRAAILRRSSHLAPPFPPTRRRVGLSLRRPGSPSGLEDENAASNHRYRPSTHGRRGVDSRPVPLEPLTKQPGRGRTRSPSGPSPRRLLSVSVRLDDGASQLRLQSDEKRTWLPILFQLPVIQQSAKIKSYCILCNMHVN